MSVYRRVNCPNCRNSKEMRNGDDRSKIITCKRCGHTFDIKPEHAIYWIEYFFNGRRLREPVGLVSKTFAETVLYKRKVEVAEGRFLDVRKKQKIKFEDFALEYLDRHSRQHKKSWITDSFHIKDFNSFFGDKHLSEITIEDIDHFKMERQKVVSKSSVNRQLSLLRGMLNKAVSAGKLQDNPMKSVQFYPEPEGRLRFLEKDEIKTLIDNCDDRLRPIVVVAVYTGLRKGEIFNLQWQDVDFKRSVITLLETKNGKSRKLPMNERVVSILLKLEKHPQSPYIFCYADGSRIKDVRKSFATALRKSGIINFHFHDLRHTFASQLVMSSVDLNTVRELMGHKTIEMTLRYAHLAPNHKQRAVDMLIEPDATITPQHGALEIDDNFEVPQASDNMLVTATLGSFLS